MRIALSYSNRLKRSSDDLQPESSGLVDHLTTALKKLGHEVELIEASGSLARFIARLEAMPPELTIHLGDLSGDAGREDLFQAIFDELGLPHVSPSMKMVSPLVEALARGRDLDDAVRDLVREACKKHNLSERAGAPVRSPKKALRVGLTFNMKREYTEQQAEFDAPTTIDAIAKAIEGLGHTVVLLEADADLPMTLAAASVDVVFNVAEGFRGRGREAQVPALCEMLGIPYTGSDPSTLSICLAKNLTKQILKAAGIDTPEWQLCSTGREKLKAFRYPVIVKPNAEGTSKGITAASVVHDEAGARAAVRALVDKYDQPALIEEYIQGREFTVGLIGERRPRVLPIMEIVFLSDSKTPVYGFEEKKEFTDRVRNDCPAVLHAAEQKKLEKVARDTFSALDCRDVARVDIRVDASGTPFVIEVNPLPGLAPDFSDLAVIAKQAGMDHKTLVGEILAGAIKRRDQERGARAPEKGPTTIVPPAG